MACRLRVGVPSTTLVQYTRTDYLVCVISDTCDVCDDTYGGAITYRLSYLHSILLSILLHCAAPC